MKKFIVALVAITVIAGSSLPTHAGVLNNAFVNAELYVWNRVADLLEVFRGGVAVGPTIGAEVAFTQYAVLGGYIASEKGVSFPHLFVPLWIVPHLEDADFIKHHAGVYKTYAYGPVRVQNTLQEDVRFRYEQEDIQIQAGLAVVHVALTFKTMQAVDFLAGLGGFDILEDDIHAETIGIKREPMRQLGRGISNVLTGIREVPSGINRVNQSHGDFAAITYGLFQGIGRFITREFVGVVEVITFPFGWQAIIEPEFPWQPVTGVEWKVNSPKFLDR